MSSGVQTAAHPSSQFHQHSIHTSSSSSTQYHQELSKMTPRPNAEESLVTLRQPPITSSRQVSRDSDLSAEDSTPASVVSPRENNDVVRHEAGTTPFIPLPVATSTSTATPHYTISPPKISMQSIDDRSPLAGTKRKMGSPSSQ